MAILWALFLVRGSFYSALLPMWEGWDEYAHFAVLQHWADYGTMPRFDDPIPREVDESMRLAPLPRELRWIGPPYLTHEQWQRLPGAEREARARKLAALPPALAHEPSAHPFVSYEAQQPPLYYALFSLPLRLAAARPLTFRFSLLRWLSMMTASFAIPLTWLAARNLLGSPAADYATAMLAVAPGFAIDSARIANDCVAILCAALVFWLVSRRHTHGFMTGLALGAALLAKAYLLALIPGLIVCWWKRRRELVFALLTAAAAAGWWYVRNLVLGYSFSGWYDRTHGSVLAGALRIDWLAAANIVAKSFIWFGAWSFLTLKSWMYAVPEALAAAGALLSVRANVKIPFAIAAAYLAAVAYGVLVFYNAHGIPNLPGWYLWPAAGAFATIVAAGLKRTSLAMILLLAAMDVYGAMAVMMPYYAGTRSFSQALANLHVALPLAAFWICATAAIPAVAAWRR